MEAREKARQLVDKYYLHFKEDFNTGMGWNITCAKAMATICADEMIASHSDCLVGGDIKIAYDEFFDYWERVRIEIQEIV